MSWDGALICSNLIILIILCIFLLDPEQVAPSLPWKILKVPYSLGRKTHQAHTAACFRREVAYYGAISSLRGSLGNLGFTCPEGTPLPEVLLDLLELPEKEEARAAHKEKLVQLKKLSDTWMSAWWRFLEWCYCVSWWVSLKQRLGYTLPWLDGWCLIFVNICGCYVYVYMYTRIFI